ncbi:hypothetical protein [Deinococcus hopiensis]|uniref:hypothetical protein n=1 Tax=Deinococcus hopiensis TaxID=309885 RepID=UPI00111C5D09|nr:hypothetical protein [Deinococcus hopiensis]
MIIATLSITTLGSSGGVQSGKESYQAFASAESGISSFIPRVKESGFTGTVYEIDCWVQGNNPKWSDGSNVTVDGGNTCASTATENVPLMNLTSSNTGQRVEVKVVKVDVAASRLTIMAKGQTGSSSNAATAKITQNVLLSKPAFLNIAAPAGLTSCPSLNTGGTSEVFGVGSENTGLVAYTTSTGASTTTLNISPKLSDGLPLDQGSFISIGGATYRVTKLTPLASPLVGTQLTVIPPASTGTALTGTLSLIPIAFRGPQGGNGYIAEPSLPTGTYRIPVSDPTSVFAGDTLYVDSGGRTYSMTVVGRAVVPATTPATFEPSVGFINGDLTQGYVDVTLGASGAGAFAYGTSTSNFGQQLPSTDSRTPLPLTVSVLNSLPVGAPMRRYIPSVMSAGSINSVSGTNRLAIGSDFGGASRVSPAAIAGSTAVNCGVNEALFKQVFNRTKADFLSLVPTTPSPSNVLTSVSRPLDKNIYWLGSTAKSNGSIIVSNSTYSLNSNDLCGQGILVVNGNLDLGGTGNRNGNTCGSSSDGSPDGFNGILYVMGNLKSQGNPNIKGAVIVEGNVNVQATTTNGGMRINYSPLAVLSAARNLSPLNFTLESGSWNQQ